MLVELRVRDLGVIEDLGVVFGPGLTALTGETGAGKTLLVDAISLLTGGPADPSLVAPGTEEARVEGRFETGGQDGRGPEEVILTRAVPAAGRSRCYQDGRMISVSRLAEVGRGLVDIHGQHAHQSLLSPSTQRRALDTAGAVETADVDRLRRRLRSLKESRRELGGDPRDRARQLDLLAYQMKEIEAAALDGPEEDDALRRQEELLADASGLAQAAAMTATMLAGDDGVIERLGAAVSATSNRRPLEDMRARLMGIQEDLSDVAGDARRLAESVEDDPARLAAVGERRRVLTELRRKYGGSLAEVMAYGEELRGRIEELASHDRRAADLQVGIERATTELQAAQQKLWDARRAAAPHLARAVEAKLRELAMPRARFAIEVGPDADDETVTWLLGANPGQPLLPLAKVASGGELARAMLATRLVMGPAGEPDPATLIFDEVDAGIGGEAAIAVGRALAALAADRQVLVVTHLAQVASFASTHLSVVKHVVTGEGGEHTVAAARPLHGDDRVVELARMLSGRPDSRSARRHAAELLSAAVPARDGPSTHSAVGRR